MKLQSVLKAITDTRFMITGAHKSPYEYLYLKIDYLGESEKFRKALAVLQSLNNPKVKHICYNGAAGCIEIEIE